MKQRVIILGILGSAVLGIAFFFFNRDEFPLPNPEGERGVVIDGEELSRQHDETGETGETGEDRGVGGEEAVSSMSTRTIQTTDGTRHSIPIGEILSGGPGKDGIPSIDEPKFISANSATFLTAESPGIGISINGDDRFYPYQILVWHEIVNDTVGGTPVAVTYCPLCATGVVYDRRVNGEVVKFGVSGLLWQSNLLMYDRQNTEEEESLWSQVLGEAVVGPQAGIRLSIVSSDIMRFGTWEKAHPNTVVLSRDTGALRSYGSDPYEGYYTDDTVSFGAAFDDSRLHQKELVLGIEINGVFKAYHTEAIQDGETRDTVAGEEIRITKDSSGSTRMFRKNGEEIPYIAGFWFSWLAVHSDTLLFK